MKIFQNGGAIRLRASQAQGNFELTFVYCDELPRSARGKYEYFVSELGP